MQDLKPGRASAFLSVGAGRGGGGSSPRPIRREGLEAPVPTWPARRPQMAYQVVEKSAALGALEAELEQRQSR